MYFIPYVQRNLDFIFSRYLWFTCQVILHDYFYRIWEDYLLLSAMHYATINLIVFKGRKYYSACVVIFHDTFWPLISVLYFICDTCIWTTFQYKTFFRVEKLNCWSQIAEYYNKIWICFIKLRTPKLNASKRLF